MLIFPVDFFMIVFITTALDTYSMISTIMSDFDFSSSVVAVSPSVVLLVMAEVDTDAIKVWYLLMGSVIRRYI